MKRLTTFIAIVARSVLAAAIGSLIYSFWANKEATPSVSQVLGIASIAMSIAFPTATVASVVALILTQYRSNAKAGWALAALIGVGCVMAFPAYMTALAPAINWKRALLLPFATYLVGLAIGALASSRAGDRKLPPA